MTPRIARLLALLRWALYGFLVGGACGVASALFLALLERATQLRTHHVAIVWALPVAGVVIGLLYERVGRSVMTGNNLVIDTIHDGGPQIPVRMAPLVLIGTVLTHLFGGSAGREGTAVQMGASLSDFFAKRLSLDSSTRRALIAAGVAGGFGSVFGTPIAGTIFGLELVVLGRIEYDALAPALVAAVIGDMTTRALAPLLGFAHTVYPAAAVLALSPAVLARWVVFAVAVALTSTVFIELTHALKKLGARVALPIRMLLGGAIVVGLWKLSGTDTYLGLGVPTIVRAYSLPSLPVWTFATKLVFTAITLGAGFLGGEVTPLFFIGATLGSSLAAPLGLPAPLAAGVGMAAVFATAANTPLALSVMAAELMGANVLPHVLIVCVVAYLIGGHRSIYPSQRLRGPKLGGLFHTPRRLSDLEHPGAAGHE